MAVSPVTICNLALSKLGANLIESLNSNNKEARLCELHYEFLRDEVLRAHHWNFAGARAVLARSAANPAFGYSFAYVLPTDCLKARRINDEPARDISHEIEGRLLLTDEATVNLVYTKKIEDPAQFDSMFVNVLAARLAYELALPIAKSGTLGQAMKGLYEELMTKAATVDGSEGNRDEPDDNPYVEARS